ncbi:hypothetical protein F5Y07DRAFT_372573 [Xylaria sp. FL0933]|nr:hypothetical protein F5Y07DRAFT_372573 [Xylaria sp. FL0933]
MPNYNTSKLPNVEWARELSAWATKHSLDAVLNPVSPGVCAGSPDPQASMVVSLLAWTAT